MTSTFRRLAGVTCASAALAALAFPAAAVPKHPATLQDGSIPETFYVSLGSEAAFRDPAMAAFPTDSGGSCQLLGSLFNPLTATVTQVFGTTSIAADNFKVAGTGPVTLNGISWRSATSSTANPAANLDIQSFTINIYNDLNGIPAPTVLHTFSVSTTAAPTPNLTGVAAGTFTFNNSAIQLRDFTATLPATQLTGGQCYWIEFVPVGIGTNAIWMSSAQEIEGDGVRFNKTSRAAASYTNQLPGWGDFHMCFNFPIESTASGNSCGLGSVMTCATPITTSCQINDGFGQGLASGFTPVFPQVTGGPNVPAIVADDFRLTGANNAFAGGCFQGFYASAAPSAATEQFRVRVYRDLNGFPDVAGGAAVDVTASASGASGATLTRAAVNGSTTNFAYNFALVAPVDLPAGNYWLEVASTSTTIRWNWSSTRAARTNRPGNLAVFWGFAADPANPTYDAADFLPEAIDMAMCVNVSSGAVARATTPTAVLPDSNMTCATAKPLVLTGEVIAGNTYYQAPLPLAPRGPVDVFTPTRNGQWFSVVGDGNGLVVSTCSASNITDIDGTNVDTVMNVYCPGTGDPCTNLKWIAGNADAEVACTTGALSGGASTVEFDTVAGQTYFIFVWAEDVAVQTTAGVVLPLGPDRGFFFMSALSNGIPADPAQFPCGAVRNCEIQIPAGAVASAEACGAPTELDDSCSTATVLTMGQWGSGTVFGYENIVDLDLFRVPSETVPAGGKWYQLTVMTEQSLNVLLGGRGVCTNDFPAGLIATGEFFEPCEFIAPKVGWFAAGGELTLGVAATSGRGNICGPNGVGNRYAVRIDELPVGACCISGVGCVILPRGDIPVLRLAADPAENNSCNARGGVFQGVGTVCSIDPGDPNNPNFPCDNAGNTVATLGTCCNALLNCTITTEAACGTAGLWSAGGICAPNPCTVIGIGRCCAGGYCLTTTADECTALNGTFDPNIIGCVPNDCAPPVVTDVVCCRGTTCTVVAAAACTVPATPIVGASVSAASACGVNNSTANGCCFADFTKSSGVNIDDIFVYLNAWFASSPYTDIGGNGVSTPNIDDIFIFLNSWFAGCPN